MSSEAGTEEIPKKSRRTIAVFLLVILCLYAVAFFANRPDDDGKITVALTDFATNASGVVEAVLEVRNDAADVRLEPQVFVAEEEEHGILERDQNGRLKKQLQPWTRTYMDGKTEKYFMVKASSPLATELRSSTGTNLNRGTIAIITFPKPNRSWRLMIDCWRVTPPKNSIRQRLEKWNSWASATAGIPVFFEQPWEHQQITTPFFPLQPLGTEETLPGLGHPF